jgi:hypothetical protein
VTESEKAKPLVAQQIMRGEKDKPQTRSFPSEILSSVCGLRVTGGRLFWRT